MVEGILIYAVPEIADLIDVKIYLDGDDDLLFMRQHERGCDYEDVKEKYLKYVKPAYHEFVEPSKKLANIVIPADQPLETSLMVVHKYLEHEARER